MFSSVVSVLQDKQTTGSTQFSSLSFSYVLRYSWFPIPEFEQVKLNCTLVQTLKLCTGHTAHRGSKGIALPFHDHGTRRGEVSASHPGRFYPRENPVPSVQEAGWAPEPVWTGEENLASTGIWSLDRIARRPSIYRLRVRYPAHWI